jgi:protein-arginine deiminase
VYDWSDYGSESCDTAWDDFGIDCATLESTYYWDCTGCVCPGDGGSSGGSGGGSGGAAPASSVTLPFSTDAIDLGAEFSDWRVTSALIVEELDASGATLSEQTIRLVSAPLILNHHLQEASFVVATELSGGWAGDNSEFTTPIADALGSSYGGVPGASYGSDVWIQDEFEFATSNAPGIYQDFIIDSIRDRGLDPWAENAVFGPDFGMGVWGSGWASSFDSFGNLEASPPVTVDGVEYPFGRVYWGENGSDGPTAALQSFLEAQEIQAPFNINTSWLAVGHVDEFVSFIPDASSAKGFKMVWSDIDMAYEILDGMSGSTSIPRYGSGHGYSTVAALRGDSALRSYNDDIRDVYLAPIKAVLFAQLGLTEADVINIPGMFEEAYGPYGAALVPGMANLVVVDLPGEPSRIFTADPFMRSSASASTSSDPFATAFEDAMPAEHEVIFVDDWNDYHLLLGEVHCGTNVIRNQPNAWWADEAALSLLGE